MSQFHAGQQVRLKSVADYPDNAQVICQDVAGMPLRLVRHRRARAISPWDVELPNGHIHTHADLGWFIDRFEPLPDGPDALVGDDRFPTLEQLEAILQKAPEASSALQRAYPGRFLTYPELAVGEYFLFLDEDKGHTTPPRQPLRRWVRNGNQPCWQVPGRGLDGSWRYEAVRRVNAPAPPVLTWPQLRDGECFSFLTKERSSPMTLRYVRMGPGYRCPRLNAGDSLFTSNPQWPIRRFSSASDDATELP